MNLRTKFSLWMMSLITVIVAAIAVLTVCSERRLLLKEMNAQHQRILNRLVKVCVESLYQDDVLLLNYLKTLESERGFESAFFADSNGVIKVHSDPSRLGQSKTSVGKNSDILFFEASVIFEGRNVGSANMTYKKSDLDDFIYQSQLETLKRMGLIMLVALLFGYVGALFLARTMVRPIQQLVRGMRTVSEGKLEPIALRARKDELGWLGDELNVTISKLKELDDMKQNFFSRITHELRSPLIAIDGLVSMILKGMYGDTSSKIKEILLTAQNNAARLKRLVDDLLTAARLEAKREDVEPMEFDLQDLIRETLVLYTGIAQEKGLQLVNNSDGKAVRAWAEPEKVQHILTNLVSNALKFTKTGRISVGAVENAHDVLVTVADTGIGIPPDEQNKIFDKFFRTSSAKKIKGTGLGLSIVKDLVEIQGGKISVAPRSGGGTIFSFTLPRKKNT